MNCILHTIIIGFWTNHLVARYESNPYADLLHMGVWTSGHETYTETVSQNLSFTQQTPMHTAAKDGDEYTMKGLVNLGADINIKDKDGVRETIP